jgi:putative oxidoreductase
MSAVTALQTRYDAITARLSGVLPESLVLAFVRVVLAGIFWRSGRTKVVEGSWFQLSDTTYELFRTEYAGVPLPPEFAAVMATTAEHLLPALLLVGLFTRFSALGLIGMTLVIQFFVYPDAWWPEHSLWTALALILIVRGAGQFSLDALLTRGRR